MMMTYWFGYGQYWMVGEKALSQSMSHSVVKHALVSYFDWLFGFVYKKIVIVRIGHSQLV